MCDQRSDDDDNDVNELSATDDSEPEEQPSRAPFDPELDQDTDDDDSGGGKAEVCAPSSQTSFSLRGGSAAFSDRSNSIFDCLDSVTKLSSSSQNQEHISHEEFVQPQPPQPSRKMSQPSSTSPTPPKKRGVPDYLVHPERWTYYNLEDVTESSDQDNRRAAHQFLSSLQQEKQSDLEQINIQQRMIFSRPKRPLKEQTAEQSAIGGQEKKMHLSHLEEEEEGEEGSDRKKARGRGTDRSAEETEGKDGDKDKRAVGQSEKEKQKPVQKEKGEDEKIVEVNTGFNSFRKAKRKNYRKSSEQGDN